MGKERAPGKPTRRRYSLAEKDQAVRLVPQLQAETGRCHGAIQQVGHGGILRYVLRRHLGSRR